MATQLEKFKADKKRISTKRLNDPHCAKELTIVAEGDSWFDYPLRKDIIDYLVVKGYAIKKFSKAGDTLENMIYGNDYKETSDGINHLGPTSLQRTLKAIRDYKPQFVLLSGGGNDIVGTEIMAYLNHKLSNPTELINKKIFKEKLKQIENALSYFINAVSAEDNSVNILMDGYDYAKVNGKGYTFIFRNLKGPWILPSMGMKGITNKADQEMIIRYFVDEFNTLLKKLSRRHSNFHHIDLRGMFPNDNEWHNEIHLNNAGFKKVANEYHQRMTDILNYDPILMHKDNIIT